MSAQINAIVLPDLKKNRRPATAQRRLEIATSILFFTDRVYLAFKASDEITFKKFVAQKYFRLTFTVEPGRWGATKERTA